MSIKAYPLTWPQGWKRTQDHYRQPGRFGVAKTTASGYRSRNSELSIAEATTRLLEELGRMGIDQQDVVLSTNLVLRLDGMPRSGQAQPHDPGAAVYWIDPYNKQPRSMAIDRYTRVEQNIAALAATIDAMRAIERHGGAVVMERAFTGFTALPAPATRDWQYVLGLEALLMPTREDIENAYRKLAREHHPDRGGNEGRMAEINLARQEALQSL